MYNQFVLVGRLAKINKENSNITLAVIKTYKNENGIYENDFVNITISNSILEKILEYCQENDIVGVRGRIETNELIADKITFLSNKQESED